MSENYQYKVLCNAYSKDFLVEQGNKNGVYWEESDNPGVNWMRFSHALCKHLDEGKEFDMDDGDSQSLQEMLDYYTKLKDMHKKTMIPLVRSAMSKLYAEKNDANLRPIDLVKEAQQHLDANGGVVWSNKVSTLANLNAQIKSINNKLNSSTQNSK